MHYLTASVKQTSTLFPFIFLICCLNIQINPDALQIRCTYTSSSWWLRNTNRSDSSVNPAGDSCRRTSAASEFNRTNQCSQEPAPAFLSLLFPWLGNNWNYDHRWGVNKHNPKRYPKASSALQTSVSSPNIISSLQLSPQTLMGSEQIPSGLAAICVGSAVPLQHGTPLY